MQLPTGPTVKVRTSYLTKAGSMPSRVGLKNGIQRLASVDG